MTGPIRVLLADDQTLVRAGFRSLLDSEDGIEVVGEAVDGQEALGRLLVADHAIDVAGPPALMTPTADGEAWWSARTP